MPSITHRSKLHPLSRAVALVWLIIVFVDLGAAFDVCGAASEDAKLAAFFQRYLDATLAQRPLMATRLGDHRFDAALEDLSAAARQRWVDHARETLSALSREIDYRQLTRDAQVDFEILRHQLGHQLWLAENLHPFEHDPRTYNDYINDSVYLLLTQSSLPRETNVANALARMRHIPQVIAVARATLRNPPRVFVETALQQNRGAIGFYERELFVLAGDTRQKEALQAAARPVLAALREFDRFLQDLQPRAQGEWRLGREKFAQKLEWELNAGLTADQVLADAEAEFERVSREMHVIARQLWSRYFPKQPFPTDDPDGRREAIQRVLQEIARDHGEPNTLVEDARATVDRLKGFITEQDILRLPEPDHCQIIEMPEFRRGNSTAYMNSPPPLDPAAPGQYAISPPPRDWDAARVQSFLEEYNRAMLQILTIHEAYPGHYVQHEYANRVPSLLRRVLISGVYVEGWAVYTEQTMLDQGYGRGDLPLRLTQLKFYLRAVVNAILDHKMHCANLTDAEAMELLTQRAFQSEGEARLKVIRAKQSSVQLSTYFVGRMAHYRLRQQVQRELGNKFQLGRFHEAVLGQGPVPVRYLPERVRAALKQ